VLVEEEPDDREFLEEWLSRIRGSRVYIKQPKKGDKLDLVKMAAKNAALALEKHLSVQSDSKREILTTLESLADLLELERIPRIIEAYDISNTGKSEIAASRVLFEMGNPNKNGYRRYRIRNIDMQDDYAAMKEVIFRRFSRDNELPDIILVDGGKGHVSSVNQVLDAMGIEVPVAGMAKDDRHRTRSLVTGDKEIELDSVPGVFRLIAAIQEEAHRFAVKYNRKMRADRHSKSELDEIPGIGPERKKALLRHFKSVKRIKESSVEEIMEVDGISEKTAILIYDHFRKGEKAGI
jgi:excinuclease ABC subunit C